MNPKQFLNHNQGKTKACTMFALANVVYYQFKTMIDPLKLWRKMDRNGDESGLFPLEVRLAIESLGYKQCKIEKTPKAIAESIAKNKPVMISVFSPEINPKKDHGWHAVVAYKVEGDTIYYINSWNPTWGAFNNNTGYFKSNGKNIKAAITIA